MEGVMNHASVMRIILLALVPLAAGAGTGGRNIIKNGDFERWTGGEPAGWETTNIPNMLTAVSSSTRSHGGKFAARCEVKDFYGTKMAGMLCSKGVTLAGASMHVKGFSLLHSVGADVGFLSIAFMNANGSSIGSVEEFLTNDSGEYVQFSREIRLPDGTARMDLHLTLLAGKGSTGVHEGSYVLFDDLECTVPLDTGAK
jgi:hypothetical protein